MKCLRKAAKAFIELEGDFELTDLTKNKKKRSDRDHNLIYFMFLRLIRY